MSENEKPRYLVKELSLIGHALVPEGTEIDNYDGLPGDNLEPLNDAARAKRQELLDAEPARIAKLEKLYGTPASPESVALAAAMVSAANQANADLRAEMAAMRDKLVEAQAALEAAGKAGKTSKAKVEKDLV